MKIIKYDDIRFKKIYLFIFLSFIIFLLNSWFVSSAFNPATFCKDKTDGFHCCNSQSYVMECLCTNEELQSRSTCESKSCINGRCVPIEEDEDGTATGGNGCCESYKPTVVRYCSGNELIVETKTPRCDVDKNICEYDTIKNSYTCVEGCFNNGGDAAYCQSDTSNIPCTVCDTNTGMCIDNPARNVEESCNANLNCVSENCKKEPSEENGDAESSEENKNSQITKAGCLICESGVCTKNPRTDVGFNCESAKNECSTPNSRCGSPCLVCIKNKCVGNPESHICNPLQNQCEEKGKACVSKEKDNEPKTLTIDIARFVRNTVSFAELGSMAGTWLDKTLGTSFFSTPLWGELEKTWPLGAKFFGGNWESSICRDLWCIIPDDTGISTVGSAIGSHIEGQKLKIGDELNLYKITFALNPATESLTGQMNFTIELYDNSGNKEYIDVNNDKKPDTWININNKYATSKTNPIAFYSEKDYQKICLRFFNTKDYIDELRLLLLSNSNQICTKFFEGDPSDAISEIQTGEIQVGGEVDECANC